MATARLLAVAVAVTVVVAGLFSSAAGACSSQRFSGNRLYSLCADLPTLSSSLHWTYDPSSSALSLAFVAAPPSPDGWVAWAINPTASGMVGAQSLIAFRLPDGSLSVKTYNVSSYGPVSPSPIAFEVSDTEAEYVGGEIRMFARVVLPAGMTKVNHVWQVGPSVTNDLPYRHAFDPPNLNAKGALDLTKGEAIATGGADSRARKKNVSVWLFHSFIHLDKDCNF